MKKTVSRRLILLLILFCSGVYTNAQTIIINGIVRDKQSDEHIPFASVVLQQRNYGVLTDSAGRFRLVLRSFPEGDSLVILNVGYKKLSIPLAYVRDSVFLNIKIEVEAAQKEKAVTVKAKYNRAVWFWRKIVANKYKHDKEHWDNYSYEIYNKLEIDINNVNKEKLSEKRIFKPFTFVFDYIDSTSEEKPYLPVYLTEILSDYYYQKNPHRIREDIKATKTNGIENESIIKQLGGMYQNINIYKNFIDVFDKQFVSPLNDNADRHYNFKLLDTQYLYNRRLIHLRFTPKYDGGNTFEGDCWVNDTTYAIQKITLRPAAAANINFVTGLSLIQEFKLVNDTTWFLYKDRFVVDIAPVGKEKLGLKGRKTTTYQSVKLNDTSVTAMIDRNKLAEEVNVASHALSKPDSFWQSNRHESLNKDEAGIYKLLDTLNKNPTYNRYYNAVTFIYSGTKDIGNVRIGPWYYWLSANSWEGARVRFDLATNKGFNQHLYLHGYGAYGFGDGKFKYKGEIKYLFKDLPWSYVQFSHTDDIDNGQKYYDQLGTDNIFSLALRRGGIPLKFQKIEESKLEFYTDTYKGFALGVEGTTTEYTPLQNLPGKAYFQNEIGSPLKTFEATLHLRYAYLESFIEDNFHRTSYGSDYPIVDIKYSKGISGILKSSYDYDKINVTVSDYLKLGHYGTLYYNVFGGKIFGTVPYEFLEVHPGNEMYYYNRYAFNLMNRFEFISDQYAGFNIEHNIGNGLFRYLPMTRILKFRQFWTAKGVVGDLSPANRQLNFVDPNAPFRSLDGKWYLEVGTGVDNIFKFFRLDLVWRALPAHAPTNDSRRFGAFGSFRLTF